MITKTNSTEKIKKSFWEIKDKNLLNLIVARDGGKTTIRIIDTILHKPHNKHQISKTLNIDYKTVTYHLELMQKYDYVTEEKFGKKFYFHPSDKLFKNLEEYNLIKELLKKEEKNEK